jgi:hypothetical protein
MAWLDLVCLRSNSSTHIARPAGATELSRLLESSQALKPKSPQAVGWSSEWRNLDSFDIDNIARSGHERPLDSTLELAELSRHSVGIASTLSTRNPAAVHPVLKLHLFRDAQVWHPHCLNPMSRRSHRSVQLSPLSGPANKKFQRLASRLIEGGIIT